MAELKKHTDKNIKIILLGNKKDLREQVNVTEEEGSLYAENKNLFFFTTSAKDNSDLMI